MGKEQEVFVRSMPFNTEITGAVTFLGGTAEVTLPAGCGTVGLQVSGVWVGQLEFEGTMDGLNWGAVEASNGSLTVSSTASNDIFVLPGAGYAKTRVRASAWTSGTAEIKFIASIGTAASVLAGALPAGINIIGAVDSAATVPSLYAVTITDANTQYSQTLPAICRRLRFQCRTAFDVRFAFVTGKVASPTDPYRTLKAGMVYDSGPIKGAGGKLYLASAQAGVVVEVEAWA